MTGTPRFRERFEATVAGRRAHPQVEVFAARIGAPASVDEEAVGSRLPWTQAAELAGNAARMAEETRG
ncbi:hypothetical protein SAMN02745121_06214 [Nannocystis exedens]|uniref:Uncharacterized protein n=1 Tax=Nannocystis exedens TaxID=54 RepID=A0A1I2EQI5_9BACT|nr:hypothetical protein [Nannocystis exedens]PCC73867.1 hypothetical protein NAEX_06955 [Nannocystis exedens]SFE95065.1 hypothetical protein SAMN02745121_06214 [Nannocystis exedens]